MSVRLDWKSKGSCETEISELADGTGAVNEQVLWLQVSVENSMLMKVDERLENLVQEALCLLFWQGSGAL